MRLRSPKNNEKGYETTQHMVSRESDSRPRFGGELECGPVSFEVSPLSQPSP